MYQFTSNLQNMGIHTIAQTYRWRGLVLALLLGWAPAWFLTRSLNWGGWGLSLFWLLSTFLGYQVGKLIKKKNKMVE